MTQWAQIGSELHLETALMESLEAAVTVLHMLNLVSGGVGVPAMAMARDKIMLREVLDQLKFWIRLRKEETKSDASSESSPKGVF